MPVGVIRPSLCRVREDLVSFGHQLEHVLGALVALILVGVEPDGQLLVRLPGEERVRESCRPRRLSQRGDAP